jgi:hypothetical protein
VFRIAEALGTGTAALPVKRTVQQGWYGTVEQDRPRGVEDAKALLFLSKRSCKAYVSKTCACLLLIFLGRHRNSSLMML